MIFAVKSKRANIRPVTLTLTNLTLASASQVPPPDIS